MRWAHSGLHKEVVSQLVIRLGFEVGYRIRPDSQLVMWWGGFPVGYRVCLTASFAQFTDLLLGDQLRIESFSEFQF